MSSISQFLTISLATERSLSTEEGEVRIDRRFHACMLAFCVALGSTAIAGSFCTKVWDLSIVPCILLLLPASVLPAIFWHDRKRYVRRDAALTLPWAVLLMLLMTIVTPQVERVGAAFKDSWLVCTDNALGTSVPRLVGWLSHHVLLRMVLDTSYQFLVAFLLIAAVCPALAGKKLAAEHFLLANSIAFIMALPIVLVMPAIGPWAGYHVVGSPDQRSYEASIRALHGSMSAAIESRSGITFPSFHVVWAILSAYCLSSFKRIRFALILTAAMIVISTVTTGWHYFTDVLGGVMLALFSIGVAKHLLQSSVFGKIWES